MNAFYEHHRDSILGPGLSQSTSLAGEPRARGKDRLPAVLQRFSQMREARAPPRTGARPYRRGSVELRPEMADPLHPVLYRTRAPTSGLSAPAVLLPGRILRQPDLSPPRRARQTGRTPARR